MGIADGAESVITGGGGDRPFAKGREIKALGRVLVIVEVAVAVDDAGGVGGVI